MRRRLDWRADGDVWRRVRRAACGLGILFGAAWSGGPEGSATTTANAIRAVRVAAVALVVVGRLKSPSNVFHVCLVSKIEPAYWMKGFKSFSRVFKLQSHHALATASAEATTTAASAVVRRRRAAYRRHRYGDCCGVDSEDDCGDVASRRVRADRATSCTSDSDSTCHHPTTAAMTWASSGLNCETKDLLKLDICLVTLGSRTTKSLKIIALMISNRWKWSQGDTREAMSSARIVSCNVIVTGMFKELRFLNWNV